MSFSTFKHFSDQRHPRSVSSACHNSPLTLDARNAAEPEAQGGPGLDEIFRLHGGGLLRYLRRRAGEQAAPDLMQEVFARAAGSQQRHNLTNPGGFLRRVARNLLIDRARKRERDNVVMFPLQEEHDAVSAPEQEWGLEAEDLLRIYEQAVEAMPPKTQRVFLMHRIEELSYREIHEQLGISVATVEYHMIKALGFLSDALEAGR